MRWLLTMLLLVYPDASDQAVKALTDPASAEVKALNAWELRSVW